MENRIITTLFLLFGTLLCGVECTWFPTADRIFEIHPSDKPEMPKIPLVLPYDKNIGEEKCINFGGIWSENTTSSRAPRCVYPERYGYSMVGTPVKQKSGYRVSLRNDSLIPFSGAFQNITLLVEFWDAQTLRLKFFPDTPRFEVPVNTTRPEKNPENDTDTLYEIQFTNEPNFGVKVLRRSTGAVIFDCSPPGFIMSDQFLQLTTRLPSANLYGIGEHKHDHLLHDMNWTTLPIFTRDAPPWGPGNLYGAHAYYVNLENDGNSNGVYLKNSNAMDILLQPLPTPAVTYRTIGGIFDFYIFLGPKPEDIVKEYTQAVGRPLLPTYWSLGFHLCRWPYNTTQNLENVISRNQQAGIPQDVQTIDIDHMFEKLDFTYNKVRYAGLPDLVETKLHNQGKRFVVIVDPAIGADHESLAKSKMNSPGYEAFEDMIRNEVYVKTSNGSVLLGKVWPGLSVYPDFTNEDSEAWLERWINYMVINESLKVDGLWIDMNEPSSFIPGSVDGCTHNELNNPPYLPDVLGGKLYDKTICMDAVQSWGRHYDVHNLYGYSHALRTYNVLRKLRPEKRPFILSRSTFPGSQKYTIHWLGDNQSKWSNMHWSIIGLLEFSMFGFSMVGADICGFNSDSEDELCLRWSQLGAFYPFARNHNDWASRDQDPASWSPATTSAIKDVLITRYQLLPFLYTLMYEAHISGSTVARPLFHEFPHDNQTWAIDKQFLWGSALLISPALEQGQIEVNAYFPKGTWFDYFTGKPKASNGEYFSLPTPLNSINLHVRAGKILPRQGSALSTKYSRTKAMDLLVAVDEKGEASGSLFWDDGESHNTIERGIYLFVKIDLEMNGNMTIHVEHNGYPEAENLKFEAIFLYGMKRNPSQIIVDNIPLREDQILRDSYVTKLANLGLKITENHTLVGIRSTGI